jgi:hypothetical protein
MQSLLDETGLNQTEAMKQYGLLSYDDPYGGAAGFDCDDAAEVVERYYETYLPSTEVMIVTTHWLETVKTYETTEEQRRADGAGRAHGHALLVVKHYDTYRLVNPFRNHISETFGSIEEILCYAEYYTREAYPTDPYEAVNVSRIYDSHTETGVIPWYDSEDLRRLYAKYLKSQDLPVTTVFPPGTVVPPEPFFTLPTHFVPFGW